MDLSRAIAEKNGDSVSMASDDATAADILLEAGRWDAARGRYKRAHDLVAASGVAPGVKEDDLLASHHDAARLAIAANDLAAARREAAAYFSGATARKDDVRIRQAHLLNGLVALAEKQFDRCLSELAQADQEDPSVWYAMARAEAGKGNMARANELTLRAANMNILPTLPYVLTRAAIAGATR